MDLDKLLNDLRAEKADCLARAAHFEEGRRKAEHEAEMIAARIQGIEEGVELAKKDFAAFNASVANNAAEFRKRKPRRDIRALVRDSLVSYGNRGCSEDEQIAVLSKEFGCRPSQIKAALRAINGEAT